MTRRRAQDDVLETFTPTPALVCVIDAYRVARRVFFDELSKGTDEETATDLANTAAMPILVSVPGALDILIGRPHSVPGDA